MTGTVAGGKHLISPTVVALFASRAGRSIALVMPAATGSKIRPVSALWNQASNPVGSVVGTAGPGDCQCRALGVPTRCHIRCYRDVGNDERRGKQDGFQGRSHQSVQLAGVISDSNVLVRVAELAEKIDAATAKFSAADV